LGAPATYRRNSGINIIAGGGGYFAFDEVFNNTDHRTLCCDFSFVDAFGHTMLAIIRPFEREMHYNDPRVVKKKLQQGWNYSLGNIV
jgi:hypothetical protein